MIGVPCAGATLVTDQITSWLFNSDPLVDNNFVYWLSETIGTSGLQTGLPTDHIMKAPVGGGAPSVVFDSPDNGTNLPTGIHALTADATNFYANAPKDGTLTGANCVFIWRIPKDGSAPTPFYVGGLSSCLFKTSIFTFLQPYGGRNSLFTDGTSLFVYGQLNQGSNPNGLFSFSLSTGSGPSRICDGTDGYCSFQNTSAVTAVGGVLYGLSSSRVFSMPLTGGADMVPTSLFGNSTVFGQLSNVIVQGGYIYWYDGRSLHRLSTSGGAETILSTSVDSNGHGAPGIDAPAPGPIVLRGDYVYHVCALGPDRGAPVDDYYLCRTSINATCGTPERLSDPWMHSASWYDGGYAAVIANDTNIFVVMLKATNSPQVSGRIYRCP